MEGYFGPKDARRNFPREYDEFDFVNPDFIYSRKINRPTDIDLTSIAVKSKPQIVDQSPDEEDVVKYVRVGLSLATLITEHLLSHPFVVLRRQCQVNHNSRRFHVVPVTLVPVIIHLHQQQGITTLWKGIGSVLLIRGMALGIEDLISKITPWPKQISWSKQSFKCISQHIVLKCITLAIITPFYSASLVETVQSDIASEKPGIFDVFKVGACRFLSWSYPKKGRMLPIWSLVVPTVVFGIFKYLFHSLVKNMSSDIMHLNQRQEHEKQGALPKDWSDQNNQDIEVTAQLVSLVISDMAFYPFETILHRLHLQGTRTIIDNLDNGLSVTPILTNYEGTLDCYRTTISQEGGVGLYKGFGALLLQFTAYTAVIKLTKFVLTQLSSLLRQSPAATAAQQPCFSQAVFTPREHPPFPSPSLASTPSTLPKNFQLTSPR